ncbi:MAG TPA: NAD(+) diphosphatase [Alphaproteobacteria bacterium]|nr:NAD(+) diphosphatase [Alphaproteobacteria bacterium]
MKSPNFYAGLQLDRAAEKRRDEAWIAARLSAGARILPVWRAQSLVIEQPEPRAVFLSVDDCNGLDCAQFYLGERDGAAYFAIDLSPLDEASVAAQFGARGKFVDLRAVGGLMNRQEGGMLAYARALAHWHSRHRFCGVCGSPTQSIAAGHVRKCANADCATEHFPRTDPAVIMLVHDGERCLLGHHVRWTIPMYSTLAGFVEPGESLEDAVAREIYEEAGIRVDDVQYHSSQPWPFPASIMLGFYARARTTELTLDPDELQNAGWFTREFLRGPHDPDKFRLPRVDSIARRLINDWVAAG